jgi:hypothetical protein
MLNRIMDWLKSADRLFDEDWFGVWPLDGF